jgi:hypothetical protein
MREQKKRVGDQIQKILPHPEKYGRLLSEPPRKLTPSAAQALREYLIFKKL